VLGGSQNSHFARTRRFFRGASNLFKGTLAPSEIQTPAERVPLSQQTARWVSFYFALGGSQNSPLLAHAVIRGASNLLRGTPAASEIQTPAERVPFADYGSEHVYLRPKAWRLLCWSHSSLASAWVCCAACAVARGSAWCAPPSAGPHAAPEGPSCYSNSAESSPPKDTS
jgi:hypothetical protein